MFKKLKRSAEGAGVPHVKGTAGMATVVMPAPSKVTLPMSQHIGAPAQPVVKKGDTVYVGTLVGKAGGFVSANIYASVSGTVLSADPGAVVIESDGNQTPDPAIQPPVVNDRDSLLKAVQACGLVGLGGAGFPTHVKLTAKNIEFLVINGAECEPYLTPDTREFLECSDTIISGIAAVMKYCEIKNCVIGIDANKPDCIAKMTELVKEMPGVTVKTLPSRYPQGAEKNLVENCTGREVPQFGPTGAPGLPADAGCVVMNVTSVSTLGKFLKTGMPLVSKRVTVDGDAIAKPQNVEVAIGTSLQDIVDFCGGIKEGVTLGKVISGGPMMGHAMTDLSSPLIKQNNGLLLFSKEKAAIPAPSACIRCGRCINGCPMGLAPVQISEAYTARDYDQLDKLNIGLCVACGTCSFVCPAKRPVTQNMALAKAFYMGELRRKQAEAKAKAEEAAKKAEEGGNK